jgi:hypothetical protein
VLSQFPEYQWVISVDLDEYLVLGAAFKSLLGYIRNQEIIEFQVKVDLFMLQTATMVDFSAVCTDDSLENLMERASIVDPEDYKAMTRISSMVSAASGNPHIPLLKSGKRHISWRGGVFAVDNGLKWSLDVPDINLFGPTKFQEDRHHNKFPNHALIHFAVRSLANIIPEVLAPNGINYLEVEDKGSLKHLFNNTSMPEGGLVREFITACGEKMARTYIQDILFGSERVSLAHLKAPPGITQPACSPALDWVIAQSILHAEGVNPDSFLQFSARLAAEFQKLIKGAVLSTRDFEVQSPVAGVS